MVSNPENSIIRRIAAGTLVGTLGVTLLTGCGLGNEAAESRPESGTVATAFRPPCHTVELTEGEEADLAALPNARTTFRFLHDKKPKTQVAAALTGVIYEATRLDPKATDTYPPAMGVLLWSGDELNELKRTARLDEVYPDSLYH